MRSQLGEEVAAAAIEEQTKSEKNKVYASLNELWNRPYLTALIVVFSGIYFDALIYPIENMLFYYEALWPSRDAATDDSPSASADYLVNVFAVIYGCMGFISSICGGVICDRLGIGKMPSIVFSLYSFPIRATLF